MVQPRQRGLSDWQEGYQKKLVSAEEATAQIKSGDRIVLSTGQQPATLLTALVERKENLRNVEIQTLHGADYGYFSLDDQDHFRIVTRYAGPSTRGALTEKIIDYIPWWVWGEQKALDDGRSGYDLFDATLLRVTPPNQHGYCCTGNTLWSALTNLKRAKLRIAEVDDNLPRTFGDTWVHVSEIDYFVEASKEMPPRPPRPEADPWDESIARYVSTLVRDGDTFQVGTGSTTGHLNTFGAFDDKNDLGYFAELVVPGTIDLVKKGIITSKYMTSHPNRFITTTLGGTADEAEYIDGNPFFELYPLEYVHDPRAISANNNMVAINNALTIDMTGQISASHIGARAFSGTGGHFAYALGAFLSKGGRYVCVLPSTAVGGSVSRIVPQFPPGQIITVNRDIADIVVTEYGIAHLLNKSQRERAQALIDIAHPDFREELRSEARKLFWP